MPQTLPAVGFSDGLSGSGRELTAEGRLTNMKNSEIRKDYIQEKYVLIAPIRNNRPHDVERLEVINTNIKQCPFCPSQADNIKGLLTLGPQKNWYVKVLANGYPAVATNNPKAYGRSEIVIETPSHIDELENLPVEHIAKVFEAYANRVRDISSDKKIDYISVFKNSGGKSGGTMKHTHTQIFATAFLPPNLLDKSQQELAYRMEHGSCVYCDVIAKERKGPRFIWEDDQIIAFAPFASFKNYEVYIMPQRHVDNISQLNPAERLSMATILKDLLTQISQLDLQYNFSFEQVIYDDEQHFCLKLEPTGNMWAGFRIGGDLQINPVSPEDAAKHYRKGLSI